MDEIKKSIQLYLNWNKRVDQLKEVFRVRDAEDNYLVEYVDECGKFQTSNISKNNLILFLYKLAT